MAKSIIGLDIGTSLIKAVELSKDNNKEIQLHAAGYIPSPKAVIASSSFSYVNQVGQELTRLLHDMKVTTRDVIASLPPSKVVTKVIDIPLVDEKELSGSLEWEAEQYIPWPISESKLDYAILEKNESKKRMKLLLVAAQKEFIELLMSIISSVGLNPVAIEPEILASVRSVAHSLPTLDNFMILSFGSIDSEIALVKSGELVFTKSFPIGGSTLTRAISEEMGFSLPQAEEYKKTYGLEEGKLENKIYSVIQPFLTSIINDIEKALLYYKAQYGGGNIMSIVLTGGSAKLHGLASYIARYFGLDCQLVNPYGGIHVDPHIQPAIFPDSSYYAIAIGLSLKDLI